MNIRTVILAGSVLVLIPVVVMVYGSRWLFAEKPVPAEDLAKIALAADSSLEQQKNASMELIHLGKPALPHVRRVLQESKVPEVRALMLMGISQTHDAESKDAILNTLDDDSYEVRVAATAALRSVLYYSGVINPRAPKEARVEAIKKLRQQLAEIEAANKRDGDKPKEKRENSPPSGPVFKTTSP